MKHLSEIEIVDALDGVLSAPKRVHLDSCDRCRAEVARIEALAALAQSADVPDPSPLFWDHFSVRVRNGIREAEAADAASAAASARPASAEATARQASRWRWLGGASPRWVGAAAMLTILLVAGLWFAAVPGTSRQQHSPTSSGVVAEVPAEQADPDADQAWALVRSVADDLELDDASWDGGGATTLSVRPGSVERAMIALSTDERRELVRLLEAETRQPGA
jgi:hypothetical protein